ncbi:MAG: glycosyltransferase family 4 protein [Thermodesulfobacteriota bacterium]
MSPAGRKKIAVIIPKYGVAGGAERYAAILTERLAENPAYEFHVLANRWAPSSAKSIFFHHVPIIRFPRFLTTLSFAWFANRLAKRLGCQLIHSHDRVFTADLFTMHGVPHTFWVREVRRKRMSLFDRATAWLEGRLLADPRCRWLLPVSSLAGEQYRREFPGAASRLRVLHPGIDLERFHPRNRDLHRQPVRERFGLADDDLVLLFVGMNFELKGLDTLIRSLPLAQAAAPGRTVRLLVVGKGDQGRYQRLAEELGVGEAVRFAGVCQQGMEEFYGAADLLALLSDFDTFGMTVLEAMAAGLPVLVSPRVGAKDLVTEGEQGYMVERDDAEAVAARIVSLLDDQRRAAMGHAARQVAEQQGWDRLAGEISRMYDAILAAR